MESESEFMTGEKAGEGDLSQSPNDYRKPSAARKMFPTVVSHPKLMKPFHQGWRREVVHRGGADESREGHVRADAYYYSPQGKKLRSLKEIDAYLKTFGSSLRISCFSFTRHPLGAGAPFEQVRRARLMAAGVPGWPASAGTAPRNTETTPRDKKVPRKKHTITLGGASSVIQVPSPSTQSHKTVPRRHSLMEKSRKAFAWKAMELKKKLPVFQSDPTKAQKLVLGRSARAAGSSDDRLVVRRPWLLAEVDDRGRVNCRQPPDAPTTVEYFRLVRATATPYTADTVQIGQTRRSAPCTLFCFFDSPQSPLALPSAQCLVCRCLSHPTCVGIDDRLTSFVCVDCYIGVGKDDGFDGIGDPVDSGSDSDPDSDVSLEEFISPSPGGSPAAGLAAAPPTPSIGRGFCSRGRMPMGVKRPRGRPRLSAAAAPAGLGLVGTRPSFVVRRRGRGSRGPRGGRGGARGRASALGVPSFSAAPPPGQPESSAPATAAEASSAPANSGPPIKKRSWKTE